MAWLQFNESLSWAIGWVVVNSIWLFFGVWLLHKASQFALKNSTSQSRYLAACANLCLLLASCVFIGYLAASIHPEDMLWAPSLRPIGTRLSMPRTSDYSYFANIMHGIEPVLPIASLAWFSGVALKLFSIVIGWFRLKRMVSHSEVLERTAVPNWGALCKKIIGHENVTLVLCNFIASPATVGWIKPFVLVPTLAFTTLTPYQLECIIAHELAHIKRRDYLINFLQMIAETFLFYHPCVWWLSNDIRQLREDCCDDIAIEVIGSSKSYGQSLLALERARPDFELALRANGGSLVDRIGRLVAIQKKPLRYSPLKLAGILIAVSLLLGFSSSSWGRITQAMREQAILKEKSLSELIYEELHVTKKRKQSPCRCHERSGKAH